MLQEKKFYYQQLKNGPLSHRKIAERMSLKFQTSPAKVRDELLKDGLIVQDSVTFIRNTNKRNIVYKLANPQIKITEKIDKPAEVEYWPCGLLKSKNNAFDWRKKEQSLFSTREIVQAQQVYHNNNQITVYSRA